MTSHPTVFVDTNVFLYAVDTSEPRKEKRAGQWLDVLWDHRAGRTSGQVLNELYVNLTRKYGSVWSKAECRQIVEPLSAWHPVPLTASLTHLAWRVEDRYGFSWWDSLIVAAADFAGCDILLTEDLQHGQELGRMQVMNPFESVPLESFPG